MSKPTAMTRAERDRRQASRYGFLFPALLLLLIVNPFLEEGKFGKVALLSCFWVVLLGSVLAVRRNRSVFFTALAFTLLTLVSPEWGLLEFNMVLEILSLSAFIAAIGIAVVVITIDVYQAQVVTLGTLMGACSVYLLIGVLFSLIYSLVALVEPTAFNWAGAPVHTLDELISAGEQRTLLYYSYVTLTTLGYGDITPVSPGARMLASLEAVVGQLYVAIMVARLVAMQTARLAIDAEDRQRT